MWCIAIRRMTARFPVITLTASLKMTSITASVLEHRSSEGHPVIVSNSDTSLIRSLYRNFTHHYIKAKRNIGVAAGEGKSATEIIAVSGRAAGWDLIIRVAWTVLPCTEYVHESCRYEQLLRL